MYMADSTLSLLLVLEPAPTNSSSILCVPAQTGTTALVEQSSSWFTSFLPLSSISISEPGAIALLTSMKQLSKSPSEALPRSELASMTRKPDAKAVIVVAATSPLGSAPFWRKELASSTPFLHRLPAGCEIPRRVVGQVDRPRAVGAHLVDLEVAVPVGVERCLSPPGGKTGPSTVAAPLSMRRNGPLPSARIV
jgi:hypothetical protein